MDEVVGKKFGKWTVLADEGSAGAKKPVFYRCRCECGVERRVARSSLRAGISTNCGCVRYAEFGQRARERITQHGLSKTKIFRTWYKLRRRCLNPKDLAYANYGGRGITVCDRWRNSFEAFAADMGEPPTPDHTIDRINNDGNYEPGNCRWATRIVQMRNTRRNRMIELDGEVRPLSEWCEIKKKPLATVKGRLKKGQSPERAFR